MTRFLHTPTTIALALFLSGCNHHPAATKKTDNETVKVIFVDGKINKELHFKNNRLHGTSKEFSLSTGKITRLEHYDEGLLQGEYKTWYPNGQLSSLQHYNEGDLVGTLVFYNEDGTTEAEYTVEKKTKNPNPNTPF